jgi:hypothetical protein
LSTLFKGKSSFLDALFKSVKSTHILHFPFFSWLAQCWLARLGTLSNLTFRGWRVFLNSPTPGKQQHDDAVSRPVWWCIFQAWWHPDAGLPAASDSAVWSSYWD